MRNMWKRLLACALALAMATTLLPMSVFAVEAGDTPPATDTGLKFTKKSELKENGSVTITMEAYATGKQVSIPETKEVPTDIVFVMDQSGSMAERIGTSEYVQIPTRTTNTQYWNYYRNNLYQKIGDKYEQVQMSYQVRLFNDVYYSYSVNGNEIKNSAGMDTSPNLVLYYKNNNITRLDALMTAATGFASQVKEKSKGADGQFNTADDVNHRIAVVGFSSTGNGYNNTELLSGVSITEAGTGHTNNWSVGNWGSWYYPYGKAMNGVQFGQSMPAIWTGAVTIHFGQ